MSLSKNPYAVVVGLCAHGLTVARALHRAGVNVVAVDANTELPGMRTSCADVRIVRDINNNSLVNDLTHLALNLGGSHRPVLFLTNDRMVEVIGSHVDSIVSHYRLSWAASSPRLLPLLEKDNIERRCIETDLRYPRTRRLTDLESAAATLSDMQLPLILKPTKPLSSFKTIVIRTLASLDDIWPRIESSVPVIAQEFIPGDDTHIRFGALYLDNGKVLARFEGRKLRSRPMGHTTIAISEPSDQIHELTARFFEGLQLSGPVSLELKQDQDGSQWVIEPTVGRTDFWLGLCIADNVNLPLIEYMSVTSNSVPAGTQTTDCIWINGERDPVAIPWLLAHHSGYFVSRRVRGLYADRQDMRPFVAALSRDVAALSSRCKRKVRRLLFGQ